MKDSNTQNKLIGAFYSPVRFPPVVRLKHKSEDQKNKKAAVKKKFILGSH